VTQTFSFNVQLLVQDGEHPAFGAIPEQNSPPPHVEVVAE
jgi:hypothetical protein